MYVGPDVVMPIASAIAAGAGMVMMFGRRAVAAVRLRLGGLGRRISRVVKSR
jgi:hypothetical protein